MELTPILHGVLPPILLALFGVSRFGARALGLAAALGALIAYGLLKQWPALPHQLWHDANGTEWLLWSLLGAALVALAWRASGPRAAGLPIAAALFTAVATHLLLTKVAVGWSTTVTALHVAGAAVGVGLLTWGQRRALVAMPQGMFPLVLASVVLSLDAGIVTLGKSALLGQLCGAIAAAFGATAGVRLWRKDVALTPADALFFAFAHGGFLLAGVHLAYLPWTAAGLAAVAPLLTLAVPAKWWSARPQIALAATGVLVVAPLLAAIGTLLAEQDPYGY